MKITKNAVLDKIATINSLVDTGGNFPGYPDGYWHKAYCKPVEIAIKYKSSAFLKVFFYRYVSACQNRSKAERKLNEFCELCFMLDFAISYEAHFSCHVYFFQTLVYVNPNAYQRYMSQYFHSSLCTEEPVYT